MLAAHILSHQASTKTVANEVPKSSVHSLAHNVAHSFLLRLLAAHNLAHQASMKTVAHEALKSSAHNLAHNIAHIFCADCWPRIFSHTNSPDRPTGPPALPPRHRPPPSKTLPRPTPKAALVIKIMREIMRGLCAAQILSLMGEPTTFVNQG